MSILSEGPFNFHLRMPRNFRKWYIPRLEHWYNIIYLHTGRRFFTIVMRSDAVHTRSNIM